MTSRDPVILPPLRRLRPVGERKPTVFLGGSIEMGAAEDWQTVVIEELRTRASLIYNPRRKQWDSSWEQSIDSEPFNTQVHWELDMIEAADFIIFHFDPNTKSPITLMELGIVSVSKPDRTYVSCPKAFWRRGNVEIVCERAGVRLFDGLLDMVHACAGAMQQFQLRTSA